MWKNLEGRVETNLPRPEPRSSCANLRSARAPLGTAKDARCARGQGRHWGDGWGCGEGFLEGRRERRTADIRAESTADIQHILRLLNTNVKVGLHRTRASGRDWNIGEAWHVSWWQFVVTHCRGPLPLERLASARQSRRRSCAPSWLCACPSWPDEGQIPPLARTPLHESSADIQGGGKVMFALTEIKGVGRRYANLVIKKCVSLHAPANLQGRR